jgi:eukaryotic-like serine/threonine-protein kinase
MSDIVLLNNRYQLQELLGSGGMSVVYRAHDRMLERDVAIKILRETYSSDPTFRERFRQEAKAAANLSHPNIVTIHDFGLDSGRLFIVMEYVPGDHLKSLLKKRKRFSIDETLSLMVQACAGVGYAHRAGLVHCDIKPHNMLITPDMRLKVADFGIARALASIQPEEKSEVVWGSPQYFSPEQAAGGAPSPASDVYSLGVVMYEMLTGQLPFTATSAEELARLHRELPPASPSQINPNIPPALEQIIIKVLSKEPSARYRTADQLGRVLVSFSQQSSSATSLLNLELPAAMELADPKKSAPPQPARKDVDKTVYQPPSKAPLYQERQSVSVTHQKPEENPLQIDWITIALGLLALIAVGGLFPFYLWVMFLYR